MATYVKEETRGRTLHLLKLDQSFGEGVTVYLDATKLIKQAQKLDQSQGFDTNGPLMGTVVEQARQYADYVGNHATLENLHNFNCHGYVLFTNRTMPPARGKTYMTKQKSNVRSDVSA